MLRFHRRLAKLFRQRVRWAYVVERAGGYLDSDSRRCFYPEFETVRECLSLPTVYAKRCGNFGAAYLIVWTVRHQGTQYWLLYEDSEGSVDDQLCRRHDDYDELSDRPEGRARLIDTLVSGTWATTDYDEVKKYVENFERHHSDSLDVTDRRREGNFMYGIAMDQPPANASAD